MGLTIMYCLTSERNLTFFFGRELSSVGIDVENSVCSCDVWRWTNGELSLSGRPWSAVNESDDDDAGSV